MAKGRKLTTSRSERFLGSYGYGYSNGNSVTGISELGEEDIWSIGDNTVDRADEAPISDWRSSETNLGYETTIKPRRRGKREEPLVGGLSLAFEGSGKTMSTRIVQQFRSQECVESLRGRQMASSVPLNVPDWKKILRVDSTESMQDSDDWLEEERESQMVPPHEYLAREYSRSGKMAATSVFEGVGRTLKGRDLSRVRDAVWSQTGFDG